MAYLDHAAATPILPEALDVMARAAADFPANPSGAHAPGRAARARLEDARDEIAAALDVDPHEVVFTSGGTESDNLAVRGAPPGRRVVSAVEHRAVLHAAAGADLVAVDREGLIDLGALTDLLGPDVGLVSVIHGSNEVGAVQPLDEIVEIARRRAPSAVVHSDAVQSVASAGLPPADVVSLTSHKLGGPRGIGALVVRRGVRLEPLLRGGGQEEGRRPGTEDVAAAAGFAVALARAVRIRDEEAARLAGLRDRFEAAVAPVACVNGSAAGLRLPHVTSITVLGCRSEDMLMLLDRRGVACSAGSACASGAVEPSHVLLAMGLTGEEARSSLRLSYGWTTTEADIDDAAAALLEVVSCLR